MMRKTTIRKLTELSFGLLIIAALSACQSPGNAHMVNPTANNISNGENTLWDIWEERATSWALYGASKEQIKQAFQKVEGHDPFRIGPGSWVYELSEVAHKYDSEGLLFEHAGEIEKAVAAYRKALLFYDIARFPLLSTEPRRQVYQRMLMLYEHINKLSGTPVEVVSIPYKNGKIRGYLRLPEGIRKPALVIYTGGLDTWKTNFDGVLAEFTNAGFATFTFDMPGTGENEEVLGPDGYQSYSRVVDYFKNQGELVDGDKIAVYTVSFSGAIGLTLALLDPDVSAVVVRGGGAHHFYVGMPMAIAPGHIMVSPMQQAILWTLGFREDMHANPEGAVGRLKSLRELSLVEQGILKPTSDQAPILNINGDQDPLIPLADFHIVRERGVLQDELLYEGDGHCAPLNLEDHLPKTINWLKEKLDYRI